MKTNSISFNNQYKALNSAKTSSNITFGNKCLGMFKTRKGDVYTKFDIFDKFYNFKLTNDIRNMSTIEAMAENIKQTLIGHFLKIGSHEYFIPNILNKAPNIIRNLHTVMNGNAPIKNNEETQKALDILQLATNRNIKPEELKSIKYLKKHVEGFANNVIKNAFSYFDENKNFLYLYIPENDKLEILKNNGFIKNLKL